MLPHCFIFHVYKMPVTKGTNSHGHTMLQSEYKLGNRQKVEFLKNSMLKISLTFLYIFETSFLRNLQSLRLSRKKLVSHIKNPFAV